MKKASLRRFCRGIVVEDKASDSNLVKVWPYEILPILDGVVSAELVEYKNDGINHDAIKWEKIVKTGHWLECEWLDNETNRVTSPDLKRREKVTIWRMADSHKYYWTVDGREDHLRRLEHIVHAYSDVPPTTLEDVELTGDNTYTHVISTRDGKIHWRTSKANGEEFLYDLVIDTANNFAMLTDDTLNRFSIDSTEKIVRMENADGAFLEMNKKDINGYAPENWNMEAVETITFKCKNYVLEAAEAITVSAGKSVSYTTKTFDLTASTSLTVDSPQSTFTGNVSVGKNLTVAQAFTAAGSAVSFQAGSATFTIPMTANGITSSTPVTAPNIK